MLECQEGAEGVPEDGVAGQAESLGQIGDVGGHPFDGPGLLLRGLGPPLGPLVHEK